MKRKVRDIRVLFVATELAPLAKVGGLGDVAGSLPPALSKLGVDITILLPKYATIDDQKFSLKKTGKALEFSLNGTAHQLPLWETTLPKSNVPVVLFEHRDWIGNGGIYPEEDGSSSGSSKEFQRFGLFAVAVAEYAAHDHGKPILHCNDWHVALSVPMLEYKLGKPELPTVLTIHNLAYQGVYHRKDAESVLGAEHAAAIPQEAWVGPLGQYVDSILAGIVKADRITTVSPTYREEILTPERGVGLHTFLARRREQLIGILNGIDVEEWNPATDEFINATYTSSHLENKRKNKEALQKQYGLPARGGAFLCGMVSRLTEQKGFDILLSSLPALFNELAELQIVILATGDLAYASRLDELKKAFPDRLTFINRFDETTAHAIYAGSDAFLMPSRFEPCGLGQMIAMRYGTPPIARATGGLKDSITDIEFPKGTGFLFNEYTPSALMGAIERAWRVFKNKPKEWQQTQREGMARDFSWKQSAERYRDLYQELL